MSLRSEAGGRPWRLAAVLVTAAVGVALLLALVVVPAVRGSAPGAGRPGTVGAHLQHVALRDAAGRRVEVPPGGGRPVLITLGASTCEPCTRELPAIEKVYRALHGQVAFYGVDIGDTPAEASSFFRGHGATFPLLLDPDATMLNAIDTTGLPTTVLLAPDGVIRAVHIGAVTTASLRSLLRTKLGVAA